MKPQAYQLGKLILKWDEDERCWLVAILGQCTIRFYTEHALIDAGATPVESECDCGCHRGEYCGDKPCHCENPQPQAGSEPEFGKWEPGMTTTTSKSMTTGMEPQTEREVTYDQIIEHHFNPCSTGHCNVCDYLKHKPQPQAEEIEPMETYDYDASGFETPKATVSQLNMVILKLNVVIQALNRLSKKGE